MKSIRLSLLVYFLGLLAVALFAASLLVYRTAELTLEAKREAMEKLIQTQYEESRRKEEERLDETLLAQAQSLARVVQVQFERNRDMQPAFLTGLMFVNLSPYGYLQAPTWIAEGARVPRPDQPHSLEPPSGAYLFVRHSLPFHLQPGMIRQERLQLDNLLLPSDTQVAD